jgi:hypothetical protein
LHVTQTEKEKITTNILDNSLGILTICDKSSKMIWDGTLLQISDGMPLKA